MDIEEITKTDIKTVSLKESFYFSEYIWEEMALKKKLNTIWKWVVL